MQGIILVNRLSSSQSEDFRYADRLKWIASEHALFWVNICQPFRSYRSRLHQVGFKLRAAPLDKIRLSLYNNFHKYAKSARYGAEYGRDPLEDENMFVSRHEAMVRNGLQVRKRTRLCSTFKQSTLVELRTLRQSL